MLTKRKADRYDGELPLLDKEFIEYCWENCQEQLFGYKKHILWQKLPCFIF